MNSVALLTYLPFLGAGIAMVGKLIVPEGTGRTGARTVMSAVALLPLIGMATVLALTVTGVYHGQEIRHVLGGWSAPVAITLQLDGLAWLSSALVLVIVGSAGVSALATGSYGPRFFFFLMMLVAGMETVVLTTDIFTMFVGFEIVAIAAYVLIAYDRTDEGLLAALKYLILSSVGILFFLIGVFLVYRDFGTLSLLRIATIIETTGRADLPTVHLAVSAVVVGIGVRTAFIPFHTWLPEAHAYAPHPVSAVLSGVLIKVSFFAIVRVLGIFDGYYLMPLLMWIGAITAVAAVLWALAQSDAKRLLAYHSISQMGYVLAVFGTAGALSLPAAFYHAMNHGLFKSLLFLTVGTVIHMTGERQIFRITPIGRRAPLLAALYVVGALAIAGIPPLSGYAGKQVITAVLRSAGGAAGNVAATMLIVAGIGTVASFLKLSRIALPGSPAVSDASTIASETRPGMVAYLPLLLLAVLTVLSGLFGRQVVSILATFLSDGGGAPVTGAAAVTSAAAITGGPATTIVPTAGIPASFYAPGKLLHTVEIVVIGVVLFRLVVSTRGQRLAHTVQRWTPDLRIVLVMFVLGLGLFAGVAYR